MFIIGVTIFYLIIIIITIVFSFKAFIVSTTLTILINFLFQNEIRSILNIYTYSYYFVLYFIFIALFTIFLGIFFNPKNSKFKRVNFFKLFWLFIVWVFLLYFGFNRNMILTFIGLNLFNFSALEFYCYACNTSNDLKPIYIFLGLTSLINGWLFCIIFFIFYLNQLTLAMITTMIILSIYYFIRFFKLIIKNF